MVIARSVSETFPYVCEDDRKLPVEQQTTFHLRRLPATVGMALDNLHEATAAGQVTLRVGDQRIVTLQAGLAGWENLNDSSGQPVMFESHRGVRSVYGITIKDPAKVEMIDLLPEDVAEELAEAIRKGNTLTRDDAKN